MTTTYSPKDPAEEIFYGIDFAALLDTGETISTATATLRSLGFPDANVATMPIGAEVIDGTVVKQMIGGGLAGNSYRLSITVETSAGQTLVEAQDIEVRPVS